MRLRSVGWNWESSTIYLRSLGYKNMPDTILFDITATRRGHLACFVDPTEH